MMTHKLYILDESTDNAKPHLICFLSQPQSRPCRKIMIQQTG